LCDGWLEGGDGAVELAEAVVSACSGKTEFCFLYDLNTPLRERITRIAREVYGAKGVTFSDRALEKLKRFEADPEAMKLSTCVVKTHLSLSHDPDLKGRPTGWELPIRDIVPYKGAGFLVHIAGDIKLMPGTCSDPAFRRVDVDVDTGKVRGLF
jgi:formate--tetrahydrofolate ligase